MSVWVLPLSRLLHYLGFGLLLGGGLSALLALRAQLEAAASLSIRRVALPGVYIVLLGGVLAVIANPGALEPAGVQGPWLFVKLPLVMVLVIAAHAAWIGLERSASEAKHGAGEAELSPIRKKVELWLQVSLGAAVLAIGVASFRFLFG